MSTTLRFKRLSLIWNNKSERIRERQLPDLGKQIDVSETRKQPFFSKDTTSVIKGVAIILMFMHHFWGFPDWILPEYGGQSYERLSILRFPLKICVLIFCSLSGYFYYFSKEKTLRYSLRKIRAIVVRYWVCLILLGTIGVLFFHHYYGASSVVKELCALQSTTIRFNWYVSFYVICMLLAPLLTRFLTGRPALEMIVYFVVIPMFFQWIRIGFLSEFFLHFSTWLPAFFFAYMLAEYSVFEKIAHRYPKLISSEICRGLFALSMLVVLSFLNARSHIYFNIAFYPEELLILLDIIIMPLELYFLFELCKLIQEHTKTAARILSALGKESTLMWFLHSVFFTYEKTFFQPLAYFTGIPVLSLIIGLTLTFVVAFLLRIPIEKCEMHFRNS